jgi:hypothetical protein
MPQRGCAAVKAAGPADTSAVRGPLPSSGPPMKRSTKFRRSVDRLVKPESRRSQILPYHVGPGRLDSEAIAAEFAAGSGTAMLKRSKARPTANMDGKTLVLTDAKGDAWRVTIGDVYQSNGVIHVVDTALMPQPETCGVAPRNRRFDVNDVAFSGDESPQGTVDSLRLSHLKHTPGAGHRRR